MVLEDGCTALLLNVPPLPEEVLVLLPDVLVPPLLEHDATAATHAVSASTMEKRGVNSAAP